LVVKKCGMTRGGGALLCHGRNEGCVLVNERRMKNECQFMNTHSALGH
jgi:hypothetical protein